MATAAFCQLREHWFLYRVEINATSHSEEIGGGTGVFWTLQELDEPPCDAYGVTAEITALLDEKGTIPGARIGIGAMWGFLCTRARYVLYKPANRSAVSVFNPQIGLTYFSIVNLYVGYNKRLFGRALPELGNFNVSLCIGLPSFCLKD